MSRLAAPRTPGHRAEFCLRARHRMLIESIRSGQMDPIFTMAMSRTTIRTHVAMLHALVLGESFRALHQAHRISVPHIHA